MVLGAPRPASVTGRTYRDASLATEPAGQDRRAAVAGAGRQRCG